MRTGSMRFGKMPPTPAMPAQAKPSSTAMSPGAASKAAHGRGMPGMMKGKSPVKKGAPGGRVKDTDRDRDSKRDTDKDMM